MAPSGHGTFTDGRRETDILQKQKKVHEFGRIAFLLSMAFPGLKTAPRRPVRAPRAAQENSKTAPRALQKVSRRRSRAPNRGKAT
eukprot:6736018-Pyramimonas_sp.AAC.1